MTDRQLRKTVIHDFAKTARAYPDSGVYWIVVPEDNSPPLTSGFMRTAGLGAALIAICENTEQSHTFGRCPDCDKTALAIRAAKQAFHAALGSSAVLECKQ